MAVLQKKSVLSRNCFMEFFRFLAAILMATYHFEGLYMDHSVYLQHFYIFVEFFFVLSGFFLAKKLISTHSTENEMKAVSTDMLHKENAIRYTTNLFLKLWPSFLIAFLFSLFAKAFINNMNFVSVVKTAYASKWQMVFGHMLGIENSVPYVNYVAGGYESALLLAGLLLFWILQNHPKAFVNLAPILILSIYSFCIYNYGSLSVWMQYLGFLDVGVLRALAGMSVGILAFVYLLPFLKRYTVKIMWIVLGICIAGVLALSLFQKRIADSDMVFVVMLFAVLICIAYILDEHICNLKTRCIFDFLGSISYEIYVIHYAVCILLKHCFPNYTYAAIIIPYFFCVAILAIAIKWLSVPIHRFINLIFKRQESEKT